VLITGESGTGKEVMARYIHSKSKRASKTFVSVNCAAIPDNLLESELFGHEKGAFTGAVARRVGKFEEANGGTLLLDEISEMDPRLQAKLLRAIQEREIDRVGGTQPIKVDIRLIATSNRNLEEEVRDGRFREDLFYRLNVVNVTLPPLRERPLDVDVLAEHFIEKYAAANGVATPALSDEARRILHEHHWRGNVRELENTMHRAILLAQDDRITPESIVLTGATLAPDGPGAPGGAQGDAPAGATVGAPAAEAGAGAAPDGDGAAGTRTLVGRTVADVERDLIIDTLSHCLGNRTHAANILGISIRTLRNKLKLYSEEGIPVPQPGDSERAHL
jgi:DNA-binding NtrC family response regulator